MVKQKYKSHKPTSLLLIVIAIVLCCTSCIEDEIGENFYTFTGQTVGQYIEDMPEEFSEFQAVLDTTGFLSLLKAYGTYTCFLPNNEAMYAYYEANDKSSFEDFELEDLREMVLNSLVEEIEVSSDVFTDGASGYYTMSGRELSFSYVSDSTWAGYQVFSSSSITLSDIDLHNGLVHHVDQVISPSDSTLASIISNNEKFSLFAQALELTEISERLLAVKDLSYVEPDEIGGQKEGDPGHSSTIFRIPDRRLFGFTALVESDATYAAAGITNIEEMIAYAKGIYDLVYPEDKDVTDVTDPRNSLNRFVAYHIINKSIAKRFFIDKYDNTGNNNAIDGTTHTVKVYDLYEYLETLMPNTLIEVKIDRSLAESNLFNINEETKEAIRLTDDVDNAAVNGYLHEIDKVLTFNSEFLGRLSSKRIRMDALSFFPELTNNNIRGQVMPLGVWDTWIIPDNYIERVTVKEGYITIFTHDRASSLYGDEIFAIGEYCDFSFEVSPIPKGTYEVRFGYATNNRRGIYQIYIDGQPCGIPLNLNTSLSDPNIGYKVPGQDANDREGFQNDKMMRNRGYMKAPDAFKAATSGWHNTTSARLDDKVARRILGVFTFDEMKTHTFRFKCVGKDGNISNPEFMFDYLEFVPTEMIESEGIN